MAGELVFWVRSLVSERRPALPSSTPRDCSCDQTALLGSAAICAASLLVMSLAVIAFPRLYWTVTEPAPEFETLLVSLPEFELPEFVLPEFELPELVNVDPLFPPALFE